MDSSPKPHMPDLEYIRRGLEKPHELRQLAVEYNERFGGQQLPFPFCIVNELSLLERLIRRLPGSRSSLGRRLRKRLNLLRPSHFEMQPTGLKRRISDILKPPNPDARSVMFIHHSYYHFYYLAKALRKRGWHAVSVSTEDPKSSNQPYYHGEDYSFFSNDYEAYMTMQYELYDAVCKHFSMIHFHSDTTFAIFSKNFSGNIARNGVPWDFLDLKGRGIKIGHSISGCLTGQRQTVFNSISGGVCDKCVWQLEPTVCSDAKNGFVGEKLKLLVDLNSIEIDWPADDSRLTPQTVYEPLTYCLDEEVWHPDLEVPDYIERFDRKPGEVLILHAVGNIETRQKGARNIKGSPAVVEAIERLQAEGIPVKLIFKTGIPSKDMRFYQIQADIVVDQLNYGRYGATARECMMLGLPTVCRLNPEQPYGLPRSLSLDECPLVDANEETIYDVLKDLALDPDKRAKIGEESREYALKWHSATRCAERFERIYDRMMAGQLPLDHPDVYRDN